MSLPDDVGAACRMTLPDGTVVYGRRLGDRGQPLKTLWLHGLGLTWMTWRQVLPLVAAEADCLAIDVPGAGRSTTAGGVDLAAQARRLPALLDALEWSRVVLVGHSMGGGLALGGALTMPRRVAGLVLVASIGLPQRVPPLFWPLRLPGAAAALTLGSRLVARWGGARWMAERYGYDAPAAADYLDSYGRYPVSRAFAEAVRSLRPARYHDLRRYYPGIRQPVLLIHGRRDDIVPAHVPTGLAGLLPNAELAWIERAGHIVQETRPAEVAELIADFLRRVREPGLP